MELKLHLKKVSFIELHDKKWAFAIGIEGPFFNIN